MVAHEKRDTDTSASLCQSYAQSRADLLGVGLLGSLDLSLSGLGLSSSSVDGSEASGVVDLNLDVGDDVAIQRDDSRVRTSLLDGAQVDTVTVNLEAALGLESLGDLGSGDRTEELALVAQTDLDADRLALELSSLLVGLSDTNNLALGDVVALLLELLEVALSSLDSDLLREEPVVGETVGNVDDVALATLPLELAQENNLHC